MFGIFLNPVGQTFVWHKKLLGMPFSIQMSLFISGEQFLRFLQCKQVKQIEMVEQTVFGK